MTNPLIHSKTDMLTAFQPLLKAYQTDKMHLATKSEQAEQAKEQVLVKQALTTTVEDIVNGMAGMQLNFNAVVDDLSKKITDETQHLADLSQAITVETQTLDELKKIKIAAEALDLLVETHQQQMQTLQENASAEKKAIAVEKQNTVEQWQADEKALTQEVEQYEADKSKTRQQTAEEYQYEKERRIKQAADSFETDKQNLQRRLAEDAQAKEKDHQQRQKTLSQQADKLAEYRQKIEQAPEVMKQKTQKAREAAIDKINKEAKVTAELAAKEHEAKMASQQLQIDNLQSNIQEQNQQIESLTKQLNQALQQVQTLATNAVAR